MGGIDSIRRVENRSEIMGSGITVDSGELVFQGTGVILALAVDADDNLVFTMDDDSENDVGRVYILPMTSGGQPARASSAASNTDDRLVEKSDADPGGETVNSTGARESAKAGIEAAMPLGGRDGIKLGAFMPGVAVCPATGDVYVTRGHSGLTRMLKSDYFETQVPGDGCGGPGMRSCVCQYVERSILLM